MSKNYKREQKEQKVAPQNRTETINLNIELLSKDAEQYTVAFKNRYYNQPVIIDGISAASYVAADGTPYKTHFVMSIKEFLQDPNNNLFVGAVIYVRAANLPNKLEYPISGYLPLLINGKGTEKYLGALEDAIPVIPEDSTGTDNDEILENDPPPNVTGLSLSIGTYEIASKGQTPIAYIKASWDAAIHNDLQGYESDISKTDNLHYDALPDPKFNSALYMMWDGLELNTKYYIKVRAVDLAGNTSPLWTESSITTGDGGTIEAPTGLSVASQPPLGAVVTWTASISDKIFSYEVYRADVLHGAVAPAVTAASKVAETNSTFFFDDNLLVANDYYYWVRTVGTNGVYSLWTAISNVLNPTLITDLSVAADALFDRLTDGYVDTPKLHVGAVTANKVYAGALTTYQTNVVNRYRGCNIAFSVSGGTVYWTAGTLTLAKATYSTTGQDSASWGTVNITTLASNLAITATRFFYVNWTEDSYGEPVAATGVSVLNSATYPTGKNSIVVAIGFYINSKALIEPVNTATGTIISGDHITTGSIEAQTLIAGTITSASACIGSLDASKITTGTLSASYVTISGYTADSIAETAGKKWAGETGATVGAKAGTNLKNSGGTILNDADVITSQGRAADIVNLKASVSGAGFYGTGTYLGFSDGTYWRTYINNSGYLLMKNSTNALVLQSGYFQDSAIYAQAAAQNQFNVYDGAGHCTFHASGDEIAIYPKSSTGTFLMLYGKISTEASQAFSGLNIDTASLVGGTKWALKFTSIGDSTYAFGGYLFDYPAHRKIGTTYLPFLISGSATVAELIQHGLGAIAAGNSSVTITFSVAYTTAPDVVVSGYGSGETNNFHVGSVTTTNFLVGTTDTTGHQFNWVAIGAKT